MEDDPAWRTTQRELARGDPAKEIQDALHRFPRRGVRWWRSRWGGSARVAVAITVVTDGSGPAVLLTRRAGALHEHVGQHGLPGLRTDRGESAPDGARRALAEELGLRLPPKAVLGLLDDYQTRSGLVITPVVIWAGQHSEAPLLREARHKPSAFAVPFAELDVEPVFVASSPLPGVEPDHPVIRFPLQGGWLHAPTAAVLYQFREVVLRRRPTRVAHLEQPALASGR